MIRTSAIFVTVLAACTTDLSPRGDDAGRAVDATVVDATADGAIDAARQDASDAYAPSDAATDAQSPDAPSDTSPPTDAGPPCDPIVFSLAEAFTPTVAAPTRHTVIDVADGLVFDRIDVEIDFVRGPWATDHPAGQLGMHNVFWLHRGLRGSDWLNNNVGYLNFNAMTTARAQTNLGITDPAIWTETLSLSRCGTVEGDAYHAAYSYDAAGRVRWTRFSRADGSQLCYAQQTPLLTSIAGRSPYSGGASAFFVEIGHDVWDGTGGPEVATLGWTYSNLEVRFYPDRASCP